MYRSSNVGESDPLIFDEKSNKLGIETKTLDFYERSIYLPALYKQLSYQEKKIYCDGIKNLSLACEMGLLTKSEEDILAKSSKNIDLFEDIVFADGINVSPYPTSKHRIPKLIEPNADNINKFSNYNTIKIKGKSFIMIFVDPLELSYHNLENIIPMDYYINEIYPAFGKTKNYGTHSLEKQSLDVFSLKLNGCKGLLSLNNDAFYTFPLNGNTRGGKRFIFQSAILAKELTEIINILKKQHKEFDGFSHVNTVFRLNKFKPDDDKFNYHYDTPYYDGKNNMYSKYTMVIYLTNGTSKSEDKSILQIKEGNKITRIMNTDIGTCIIFNQKYEHQGNPMVDNDKIFIRTELIFKSETKLSENKELGKYFSSACYLFKESLRGSVFSDEFAKYSDEYFNRVNRERFNFCKDYYMNDVFIIKDCGYTVFCTNGYDYWFPICEGDIKEQIKCMTIVAILDYFSGVMLSGKETRFKCEDKIVKNIMEKDICKLISDSNDYGFGCLKDIISDFGLNHTVGKDYVAKQYMCCPYHYDGYGESGDEDESNKFNPEECDCIIREVKSLRDEAKKKINNCSVVVFDDIFVNEKDIIVENNTIVFESTGSRKRVNFASCWNCEVGINDFISKHTGKGFTLPIINYDKVNGCIHMIVDMFNNNFTTVTNEVKMYDIIDLDNY